VREAVLADAVRAYKLARIRGAMQKRAAGREEVEALAERFPEAYSSRGAGQNLAFCGRTADDILEDYLQGLGEARGSKLWIELAGITIARGERVDLAAKWGAGSAGGGG
tara:strand:- start:705 stop:1031 length:327 start_codon:yes stop_codon:yes gene_type:complete